MKNKIDSEKEKQGENKYIDKIRRMTWPITVTDYMYQSHQ
jgi:hypothetical protein